MCGVALLKARQTGRLKFDAKVWKKAKAQLKRESHGKCAYCESPTTTVAHGDVEHFRPKSTYWWLAYCYDNLLFACQICNESYKGDGFPTRGRTLRPPRMRPGATDGELEVLACGMAPDPVGGPRDLVASLASWSREGALLVNPYAADPELVLVWRADDALKEVVARSRSGRGSALARRALIAMEEFYGLNREDLVRERYRVQSVLAVLAAAARHRDTPANLKERARERLREAALDGAPYAGMARHFIRRVWRL